MADPEIERYAKALVDAVTTTPGTTSPELRKQVVARAGARIRKEQGPSLTNLDEVIDAVAVSPHQANIAGMLKGGSSEDFIYEVVCAAAVGAGLARVEKALAVIKEAKR